MNEARSVKLAPSILSADLTRLGDEVRAAEAGGADYIHIDVMDGHFVPNLTWGPPIVEAVRRVTALPLDVHLMIETPEHHIERFVEAGASIVTVHQEACRHLNATLASIRRLGARAGVSINPSTPSCVIEEVLNDADLVLVMTVNPGFGGQRLIPGCVEKARRVAAMLSAAESAAELQADGGIGPENAGRLVSAGVDVLVAGSAVFNDRARVAENLLALRTAAARRT